jgi:hypothetical protein
MSNEPTPSVSTSEPLPASATSFVTPAAPSSNLPLGIGAGGCAAVIGAVVWAGIAYATGYVIGYIAIGIGFLVGLAIRKFGRGTTQVYGLAGGALALAGCLLGDLFTGIAMASKNLSVSMMTVFENLPPDIILSMIKEQDPMGWIIYGIAVYAGFKYSVLPAVAPAEPPAAN